MRITCELTVIIRAVNRTHKVMHLQAGFLILFDKFVKVLCIDTNLRYFNEIACVILPFPV